MIYQGLDVLTVAPEFTGNEWSQERAISVVGPPNTVRNLFSLATDPATVERFRWVCLAHAEAKALNDFLDARAGRLVPFWNPTWMMDLRLFLDVGSGVTSVQVHECGYTTGLFPSSGARRHIAFWNPSRGIVSAHKITAASSVGGGYETLTITPATGEGFAKASFGVCFLRLSRQAEDATPITWRANGIAEAEIPFVELPGDAPT